MIGLHSVLVAGADISCLVDSVSISHGRDDPGSQPEASSATISLSVDGATAVLPLGIDVGSAVLVTTQTAGGTWERFTGRVTDMALGWDEAGESTPDNGVGQIVAVSSLADLGRRVVGDVPWPQELDGARVARVMAAAGITLDPLYSDPGTVQLLARDVDAQQALGVAQAAAVDGAGVLWQTRAGQVRYADANHRRGTQPAVALDACDLLVSPTWRRTLEGLVNSVSIGYGAEPPEGGEQPRYTADNADSIARWGTYGYSSSTELAALADAQAQGQLLLVRNSSPVWVMAALPVDMPGLDAARYDALLGLDMHSLITLTGLPSLGAAPTATSLWVEGWKEELAWGSHQLELVVSGYCRTVPAPRWDDLSPEWLWGTSVLTEQRRNHITNPSFEVDTSGYTLGTSTASFTRDTSTAVQGAASLLATRTSGTVNFYTWPTIPAAPGEVWTFSLWYRTTSAVAASVVIHWLNASSGIISQPTISLPASSSWVRVSGTFTAPAATAAIKLNPIYAANGANGDNHWFDGIMAERAAGPVGAYFDGATPDTSSTDYAWEGAPHASPSVQSALSTTGSGGLPPDLTWDSSTCLGPPINIGRWNDQPATLRWDQLTPSRTWDTYQ